MNMQALKAQIVSKKLDNFYIFVGPERKVAGIYIEQMANAQNATVKNLESITVLAKILRTPSMFKQRHIYIVSDDKDILSDENAQAFISRAGERTGDIVVLLYEAIDKRKKLYKSFEDRIVEFEHLPVNVLRHYAAKKLKLRDESYDRLIAICEQDYGRLLLEMDKIACYSEATEMSDEEAFQLLVDDGTIFTPPTDAVFKFVDAVLYNRPHSAFDLLDESLACGEANLVLLANLYSSAKQVLQVQATPKGADVLAVTGLTAFQVKCGRERSGRFSNGDLIYLMRLIQRVESGIKRGDIEEDVAVPYVLVNFW